MGADPTESVMFVRIRKNGSGDVDQYERYRSRTCKWRGPGKHVVGEDAEAPPVHLLPMPAVDKH